MRLSARVVVLARSGRSASPRQTMDSSTIQRGTCLLGQTVLVAALLLSLGPAVALGQDLAPASAAPSTLPDLVNSPPFTMPPSPPSTPPAAPAAVSEAPACAAPLAHVKWLENLSVMGGLNG